MSFLRLLFLTSLTALTFGRFRSQEYDTYRDPAGPFSAGAQILYGVVANFITRIVEIPLEMVRDLESTGKTLNNPYKLFTSHSKSHVGKSHHGVELESKNKQKNGKRPRRRSRPNVQNEYYQESGHERITNEDDEANIDDLHDNRGVERKCSLQPENLQTMSGGIEQVKRHSLFREAACKGNRMSKRFINIVLFLPTDLTLTLSKGFHNAPKLYNDPMVKPRPKVHGVRSGFRAAATV